MLYIFNSVIENIQSWAVFGSGLSGNLNEWCLGGVVQAQKCTFQKQLDIQAKRKSTIFISEKRFVPIMVGIFSLVYWSFGIICYLDIYTTYSVWNLKWGKRIKYSSTIHNNCTNLWKNSMVNYLQNFHTYQINNALSLVT